MGWLRVRCRRGRGMSDDRMVADQCGGAAAQMTLDPAGRVTAQTNALGAFTFTMDSLPGTPQMIMDLSVREHAALLVEYHADSATKLARRQALMEEVSAALNPRPGGRYHSATVCTPGASLTAIRPSRLVTGPASERQPWR